MGVEAVIATQVIDTTPVGRSLMTAADAAAARTAADAQATLVSGTNIKTINSTSLLGSGDIAVSASPAGSSGQAQYNNGGAFGGMTAVVYAGSGTHLTITSQAAATIPLCVKGAASQTGNLLEIKNSAGNNLTVVRPSGILHVGEVVSAVPSPEIWIGNISQAGDISLRGDWSASGRYGLSYDASNDATVLYSYSGRKFILGTRTFAGAFQPRFTFNDASGVQTWTHTEGINYVFGTSTGTKIGTGTTQKIGFWNATPVVQQVLATGTGATVDDVISLLQTLGLCKQS